MSSDTRGSWSRDAVIYQIYVRSFADSDGDGVGDLIGVASRLDHLAELGVDAVWLTPFYRSPMADGGYDVADYRDVDPRFGTLADFDKLLAEAHATGPAGDHRRGAQPLLRPARLVPGRARGRTGLTRTGAVPLPSGPRRWRVAAEQLAVHLPWPGLDPAARRRLVPAPVRARAARPQLGPPGRCGPSSTDVLRFWLDRGVDGIRIDVAHGLVKAPGLPDAAGAGAVMLVGDETPFFDQDGVHEIYREWRSILDGYAPERIAVAEAWLPDVGRMARYVRPGELHQSFNFEFLGAPWRGSDVPPCHRLLAERDGRGRGALHLGAVQPRRGPARVTAGGRGGWNRGRRHRGRRCDRRR